MTPVGSVDYFIVANNAVQPTADLWSTNGTAAGTQFVRSLYGDGSSYLTGRSLLTNVNGTLYFGRAGYGTNVNGTYFFDHSDSTHGTELWRSSATGTSLVKDIYPGYHYGGPYGWTPYPNSSYPSGLTNVNGTLFFAATDGNGYELWRSDGTEAGTTIVSSTGPYFRNITDVNGTAFFFTNDGTHGPELWKSDGTAAGTVLVQGIGSGNYIGPDLAIDVNGTLFFSFSDANHHNQLWESNGTGPGTLILAGANPTGASRYPSWLTNVNGTLFFESNDGTHGAELWRSNGSDSGTFAVADINPGGAGSAPSYLTNVNGTLLFEANDGVHGSELWKSNGTAAGTVLVKDINPGIGSSSSNALTYPSAPTNSNGTLFFVANDGVHGFELWRSNGTVAGTTLVKDMRLGPGNSMAQPPTDVNGTWFFSATDGVNGSELWRSSGTAANTFMVADINPGSDGSYPGDLTNVNGTLFFSADDGAHGRQLWKSDGTAAGTTLVGNGYPGGGYITNFNGTLFFSSNGLWRSDGTGAGLTPVLTGDAFDLTNVNGTLFFLSFSAQGDEQLWETNGTAAGTTLIQDAASSIIPILGSLTNVNGTLFFNNFGSLAAYGNYYTDLWRSDGTAAGTQQIVGDYDPADVTNVNGTLFFTAGYHEPWESNGVAGGAFVVDSNLSAAADLTNVNGALFFSAYDGTHGSELWRSDGTTAGTQMVRDIYPGNGWSAPHDLTNVNGTLFFVAADTHGNELWESNGTEAGTNLVPSPGPDIRFSPRYLNNLTNLNGTLFFITDDGVHGVQPWVLDPSAVTPTVAVTSSPNPSLLGQTVTITATVTQIGGAVAGSVDFTNGTRDLTPGGVSLHSSGVATFATSSLPGGTQTITATYLGNIPGDHALWRPLVRNRHGQRAARLWRRHPDRRLGHLHCDLRYQRQ